MGKGVLILKYFNQPSFNSKLIKNSFCSDGCGTTDLDTADSL